MHGDFDRSNSCDREFSKISEFFGMEEHFEAMAVDNDKTIFPPRKKPAKDAAFSRAAPTPGRRPGQRATRGARRRRSGGSRAFGGLDDVFCDRKLSC